MAGNSYFPLKINSYGTIWPPGARVPHLFCFGLATFCFPRPLQGGRVSIPAPGQQKPWEGDGMAVFGPAGSATTQGPHGSNGSGRGISYGRTSALAPQWPQRQPSQPVPPEATTKATGVGVRIRTIHTNHTIRTNKNTGETLSSVPRSSRTNGGSARPVLAVRIGIGRAENSIEPRIEGGAH